MSKPSVSMEKAARSDPACALDFALIELRFDVIDLGAEINQRGIRPRELVAQRELPVRHIGIVDTS